MNGVPASCALIHLIFIRCVSSAGSVKASALLLTIEYSIWAA